MACPTEDENLKCDTCASLEFVHWNMMKWSFERRSEGEYCPILHKACRRCDEAERFSLVELCESCQHIRLRHLLLCCSDIPSQTVRLYPFRLESQCCDFCQLIASYVQKTHRDSYYEKELENTVILHIFTKQSYVTVSRTRIELHATSHENQIRVSEYVDWTWLQQCVEEQRKVPEENHRILSLRQELQEMRVIDISQNCVVPLPAHTHYVSLSYVWGKTIAGQFQTSTSNIHIIQEPGGLQNIDLPSIICDAITVCRHLGYRFLWIDRLCITQDDSLEKKSIQLNQMASIYNQASLTIVAAAGDGATCGLAGISRRRKPVTKVLRFHESFLLGEAMPYLADSIEQCKWWERGWTYQEHIASSLLLYFIDFGVFYDKRSTKRNMPVTERRAIEIATDNDLTGQRMIETYTRRNLTYPTDILRAFSGIPVGMYGGKTTFGLPLEDFDRTILWNCKQFDRPPRESTTKDTFPSWCWSSANGSVEYPGTWHGVYSLAYWGRPDLEGSTRPPPHQWLTIGPPSKHSYSDYDNILADSARPAIGLALSNGCVRSESLDNALFNCSGKVSMKRLWEEGPGYMQTYWNDMFQIYADLKVFDDIPIELMSVRECLAVHTQKTYFTLDPTVQPTTMEPGENFFIVRTKNGKVAGSISLAAHTVQRLDTSDQVAVQFIAFSTASASSYGKTLSRFIHANQTFDISTLYGCPCTARLTPPIHIAECPKHPSFWATDSFPPWDSCLSFPFEGHEEHIRALRKHLAEVSYHEVHGNIWDDDTWDDDISRDCWRYPPELNVMLIVPMTKVGEGGETYQTLGIGTVYLRRWVEAGPRFETFVLQ